MKKEYTAVSIEIDKATDKLLHDLFFPDHNIDNIPLYTQDSIDARDLIGQLEETPTEIKILGGDLLEIQFRSELWNGSLPRPIIFATGWATTQALGMCRAAYAAKTRQSLGGQYNYDFIKDVE